MTGRGAWLLTGAAAGLMALAGLSARATYGARTTADEPQYLLTASSLVADGDLDISNQIADQVFLPYHEIPIDPQTTPLDASGREVSPHDPLLPVLLALPYGVAGWIGAKASLALLAALTAGLTVWVAVRRLGVAPQSAAVAVAAAFAGLPLAGYGSQVYPEMPAALALLTAVAVLLRPVGHGERGKWDVWPALAAVVALPWLSVKYVPVAAVAGLALLRRSARTPHGPRPLPIMAVAAAAGLIYLGAHQLIYGGWTAYASGDHFVTSGEFGVIGVDADLSGRSRRLVGLLVDRGFGIATWNPTWLLAVPALAAAARSARLRPLVATVVVGWLNATFVALTMHGWWVPGRQLVVVLPLAALALARWIDGSGRRLVLSAVTGAVAAVNWLWLAVEATTDRRTLVVDFADTGAPFYRVLRSVTPDGIRASGLDDALLGAWAVIVIGMLALGRRSAAAAPRARPVDLPLMSVGECAGEDLPGQRRLGQQAEQDVGALSGEILPPASDLAILRPLGESEAVEKQEQGDEDSVDKPRRLGLGAGGDKEDTNGDPRDDAKDAAHPERPQRAARRLVPFLHRSEEDHSGIDPEEGEQGGDIGDPRQNGDEDDHDR